MPRFECDYLEGADAHVLEALCRTNDLQTPGYGEDDLCDQARVMIAEQCRCPGAGVHFFCGRHAGEPDGDRRGAAAL